MKVQVKHRLKKLRHLRIRHKVCGTSERPRMSVRFTGLNIHVQFIDDTAGRTVAAVSTVSKALRANGKAPKANVAGAAVVGKLAAEAAKSKGVTQVVFDRGGAKYHGKVKTLADAAREAGLVF